MIALSDLGRPDDSVVGHFSPPLVQQCRVELNAILSSAESLAEDPNEARRADDSRQILLSARRLLALLEREFPEVAAAGGNEAVLERSTPPFILYIEDDLVNFTLVRRILADRAHVRLEQAATGEAGLAAAFLEPPQLILLDLNLPDLHGSEVLRRLRENPNTAQIPVIVISADATPGQIDRLLAAGARDYLIKPFQIQKFLGVVRGALEELNTK